MVLLDTVLASPTYDVRHLIINKFSLTSGVSLRIDVSEELTPERSEAKMLQRTIAIGMTILSIMAYTAEARKGMKVSTVLND